MITTTTIRESQSSKPRTQGGLRQGYSIAPIYKSDTRPDYRRWSVEELRVFATQMQLPHAARKSRSELLAFFGVSSD